MDWHPIIGTIGGLLALGAIIPYIKDIFHGTTRPNVVSYSIWAALLLISILAQWSAGASWSILLLIGDFIGTSTIVVLCFIGYGYKKYSWVEWTSLILAVVATVAWQLTKEPVIALVFAIIADALAALPTLMKSIRDPWSEFPLTWFMIALGALFSIFSSTIYDTPNLLFPFYLLIVNGSIGIAALIGRRIKPRTNATL